MTAGLLSRVAFASAVALLASVQAYAQETPLVVSFESANYRVLEGEELRVNVVVTPAPDREVTIPITVAPYSGAGVPAEEGDYTVQGLGAGGALTFAVGDAVETFVVRAEEDNRDNEIEDVAFDFGSLPSGVTSVRPGNRYGAILRILDNDWKATLSKRDNWPPERHFLALPFTDPEGDELDWWLDGPDADYFLVEPFHLDGVSYGLFYLGWDTVWDSDVKDTYTFIFYLSDGSDGNQDPDGGLPDHRGVLVVTVTPGPEIVLQPASVPEGTETDVRIVLANFLPANDQVTISVGGQCGMDSALSVTGGGTLSITTDDDGAANVVVPFTAGAVDGNTRCEVVATGSAVPSGSIESDTVSAALVVETSGPQGPALTDVRADPDTITVDEKSTLRWTPRENVESVVVSSGDEELATVFTAMATSYEVRPTETTTYTLSAQDSEGAPLGDFTVTVTAVRPPDGPALTNVRADPDTITVGEKSTLRWTPREDIESVVVSSGGEELATVFTATDTAYVVRPTETTTYTLSAQDSEGAPLGDFPVTVTVLPRPPTNRTPTVSASCDPCEVVPGSEVKLSATASDPDGDPLTYAWSAPQGSFSGATDGATARWTAPAQTGRVTIRVQVSDGQGGSASADVAVEVADRPRPPTNRTPTVSASCDPCEVVPGSEVKLSATASDPDGDPLTYAWSAPQGSFSGATDGATARWTAPAQTERVTIRVRVSDGRGGTASADVAVEVADRPRPPTNRAPTVSASCDPCEVASGGEVKLSATASDPDGDPLTYAWSAPQGSFSGATDGATARWTAPAQTERVTIRVRVSDGRGGTASAGVSVEVTNRPPAFKESTYHFELPENQDGSRRPVELGRVTAEDPEGDALTFGLVSGDGERFAIRGRDGGVTYVGPGEDFETEPNRYDLAVRARDTFGAEAPARVVVTVTDVNERPVAVDDEAETPEDRMVTVDVLANDADPDGDRLRVETVSAAIHGTPAVTAGGAVTYTPEANYHGADRFTYVVSDGRGETATATVDVTVVPVNDAPVAVGVIPDQVLDEGGGEVTVDLTPFFEDPDGDALTFRAASSDTDVATVTVAGAVLTLTPAAYGAAAVTVTVEDPGGLTATQTFAAGVSDRLVRAVLGNTLAAMARSHLASARMTLGRRVTSGAGERSRLTVRGRSVPLGTAAAQAAVEQMAQNWLSGFERRSVRGLGPGGAGRGAAAFGRVGMERRPVLFSNGPPGLATTPGGGLGSPALDGLSAGTLPGLGGFGGGSHDLLRGTDFLLAWGGGDGPDEARRGRRWQVWGQGDVQAFRGTPSAASGYDGDVRTAYLGVDTRLTDRWLAGVALARSGGVGDWRAGTARSRLTTTLTAVHPYAHWSDGATAVWTMFGGGRGAAENVRDATGRVGTSALGLRIGLVEVRRGLGAAGGGVQFGVRGDAAWARLATERGEETVDAQRAAVNQMRLGADMSRPFRMANGLALVPFGEAHVRRDGGAGQNGTGLEFAGGLRAVRGMVRVDAQARLLVLHSATGYRERGAGVSVSVGDQGQEGLSLSLSPSWGDQANGTGTLWQDHVYRQHMPGATGDEWAVDARGGYGMRLRSGGLLTWFGEYSQSRYGRRFLVGGGIGVFSDGVRPGRGSAEAGRIRAAGRR